MSTRSRTRTRPRDSSVSRSRSRSKSRSKHNRSSSSKKDPHSKSSHHSKEASRRANRSTSRSYSHSPSRTRSRSRSRSKGRRTNYRENAELPSDHPLFGITKQRQSQQKSSRSRSRTRSPSHGDHDDDDYYGDDRTNYRRRDSRDDRHDYRRDGYGDRGYEHSRGDRNRSDRDRDRDRYHHGRDRHRGGGGDYDDRGHHYRDRWQKDGGSDYGRYSRDGRRRRDRYHDHHHRRDGALDGDGNGINSDPVDPIQDVNNLHSKFELNFHTGHKQQVAKKRKQEIEPQITAAQAKEIIAVTTIVQQQEQISEIVETQQRKLKQKNTLEAIKEKILRQKQQMAARKQKQKEQASSLSVGGGSGSGSGHSSVFTAASALNGVSKATLPNMTSMMMSGGSHHPRESVDSAQRQAIEHLAQFVKSNGHALEQVVRDRSRDDPKFSWLYDEASNGFKYYQYLLHQQQSSSDSTTSSSSSSVPSLQSMKSKLEPPIPPQPQLQHHPHQSTVPLVHPSNTTHSFDANSPPSSTKRRRRRRFSAHPAANANASTNTNGIPSGSTTATSTPTGVSEKGMVRSTFSEHSTKDSEEVDMRGVLAPQKAAEGSLHKMDAYISTLKKRDKKKNDTRYDRANEMSIFNGGSSHHIGDYLPEEELSKFKRAAMERKMNRERDERHRLTNQNRGHAMLRKLGWNEGQGLGRQSQGMRTPVSSRMSKKETNSGVGGKDAGGRKPWDPEKGDDEFDLYKKKMMLSYRYRPNPLGNPRKDYY